MRRPARQFGAFAQPLDDILGTPSRIRVLRALDRTSVPLSATALSEETRLAYNAVAKALDVLVRAGVVVEHPTGSSFYSLAQHPFKNALSQLFQAERERRWAIQRAVEHWVETKTGSVLAVWLFGSVARREDSFESDIDLAVIAPDRLDARLHAENLSETLAPIAEQQRLRPNVISFGAEEIGRLPTTDPALWENLSRDAVPLFGPAPFTMQERVLIQRANA